MASPGGVAYIHHFPLAPQWTSAVLLGSVYTPSIDDCPSVVVVRSKGIVGGGVVFKERIYHYDPGMSKVQ